MARNGKDDHISEEPAIKRGTWFAAALTSMIITMTIGVFAAAWVFTAADPASMVQRAQAFTPFGAALLAIVTFCTVAWRGVINTEQLERQADQLQQQIRQNDAKDEENLAKLLLDGTKLLDAEQEAYVLASIAALQAVATSPNGRFATEAMNILLGVAAKNFATGYSSAILNSTLTALQTAALDFHRFGTRTISLEAPHPDFEWPIIEGPAAIFLKGGVLFPFLLQENGVYGNSRKRVILDEVKIMYADLKQSKIMYRNCILSYCTVKEISAFTFRDNIFLDCDFSGAECPDVDRLDRVITQDEISTSLAGKGNFYNKDNPPKFSACRKIMRCLEER